jgi:hypothetical protein
MRKLLIISFLFLSVSVYPATYYVSTTGSDSYPGTLAQPWATWQKAFSTAIAGDTVYFRGGTWYPVSPSYGNNICQIMPGTVGSNGEPDNPICYFNYPGEVPILDCRYIVAPGVYPNNRYLTGIAMYDVHWINWKGLTIRNIYQRVANVECKGFLGYPVSNMTFENMTVYNIGTIGYYLEVDCGPFDGIDYGWDATAYVPYSNFTFTNCDTYQCCDTLPVNNGQAAGNQGDGFKIITVTSGTYVDSVHLTMTGNRSWHCADDGFDIPSNGWFYFVNNWSFLHDYPDYNFEGNGIKKSSSEDNFLPRSLIAKNLFAFCDLGIFEHEYWANTRNKSRIYNNTIYKCDWGFLYDINNAENPADTTWSILRNNLVYGTRDQDAGGRPYVFACTVDYLESNNTWDYWRESGSLSKFTIATDMTVTNADFTSVDSATIVSQLTAARKADGSLPDLTVLQLVEESDLVDVGISIPATDSASYYFPAFSLNTIGSNPDIGAFEYGAADSTAKYITAFSFAEQTGAATIDTSAKTVDIEVEYGTAVTALVATFTLSEGATAAVGATPQVSGTTENDFTSPVTYVVTALDESTENWTVTVTVDASPNAPTVATASITSYNARHATMAGNVISDGGGTLTARGICYSTSENPTTSDNVIAFTPGEGSYSIKLTTLQSGTTYHVRAYATNETGTSYGQNRSFTTPAKSWIGGYRINGKPVYIK